MSEYKAALRKALVASGSGQYIIPEDLESLIRANLLVTSPLAALVPVIRADGNVHKVPRRTAHNANAWFQGEMTPVSYSQSTYDRRAIEIKILRTGGQASDFMVSAAKSFTDVLADEIESATEGMSELFEFATLWGVSDDLTTRAFTGDAYQYTGAYGWILEDAPSTNVYDLDGVVTLSALDSIIDVTAAKYRGINDMQYMFVASPQMISKISGLQTLLRRDAPQIKFEGGFVMESYRGYPIMSSGFLKPSAVSPATITSATATGSGGACTLPTGTYRYRLAAITLYGEQAASATITCAVTNGTHDYVALAWTAVSGAKLYALYRTAANEGDDGDNYDLIDIFAANTYDGAGSLSTAVTSYQDAGKAANTNIHPLDLGDDVIFFVGLGEKMGISRPVLDPSLGDPMNALIKYVPLSETTDSYQFRLKSYHALQVPWGQLHGQVRRVTLA